MSSPNSVTAEDLLAFLAGEGRFMEARRVALLLVDMIGYEAANCLWRDYCGRGLFDED